jgi:hypothetical protein
VEYDTNRIDEATLALLFMGLHDREEGLGARAWKGFDWETMNRLHEKGFISDPKGKAKSVRLTETGCQEAERLFCKLFGRPA